MKTVWRRYKYLIIVSLSIIFLIVYGIYCNTNKRTGSWSTPGGVYSFLNDKPHMPRETHRESSVESTKRLISPYTPPHSRSRSSRDSKGEVECRRVMELIYGLPFNKARPDFLRNPVTGNNYNLELDCYNPKLKIAVEYNGVQHYKYTPFFHKNKEAFLNQKYRDDMKERICKENGVRLIQVPYSVPIEGIHSYLINELEKNML